MTRGEGPNICDSRSSNGWKYVNDSRTGSVSKYNHLKQGSTFHS